MSLQPIPEMTDQARRHRYAVGYFESWDLASLQGVIDAAEAARSPVIIGFNGEFLSRPGRNAQERLDWYGALGRAAAESARVPCGFVFNECPCDGWVRQAVTTGFNLVMPADPGASLEDYTVRVAELTKYAHRHGVAVEAEIGELPFGSAGKVESGGGATEPDAAVEFVRQTGVDLLAVSVGNVHALTCGQRALDLDHLAVLHESVAAPLVLHGGSGIEKTSLRQALSHGVVKVNYGTILKQRYLAAVRLALKNDKRNPHHLLGYGGDGDMMVAGRRAIREVVLEKIEILGAKNRA